jgi:hypothetical protein
VGGATVRVMRFLWAVLAMSPFATVAVGMITGRVRARSCCSVPAEHDARLLVAATDDTAL